METVQLASASPRPGYGPLPTPQVRRRRAHLSAARAGILDALIDQPEPCTVAALSAKIRQHPNTIREHLDTLIGDRLAVRTQAPAKGRGRPAWLYSAAPEVGSEPGLREYAALASVLAAQIARTSEHPRADAIEAGRMWGHELVGRAAHEPVGRPADEPAERSAAHVGDGSVADGAVATGAVAKAAIAPAAVAPSAVAARRQVVSLLEELGFEPSADARTGVVKLRRCPLLEAAHRHPEVVCGVHLGIVRGVLDELGADRERTENIALKPFSEPGACRLDLLPRSEDRR